MKPIRLAAALGGKGAAVSTASRYAACWSLLHKLQRKKTPRMAFFCVVLYGFCALFSLMAEEGTGAAGLASSLNDYPLGAKTEAAFDTVCAEIGRTRFLVCDFTQTNTAAKSGRTLVSGGKIIVDKERGIVIKTETPVSRTLFAGEDFVVQTGADGVPRRLGAGGSEAFRTTAALLKAVFSGDARALKVNYAVYFKGEAAEGGTNAAGTKGGWAAAVRPQAGGALYKGVVFWGDARDLETIVFSAPSGDTVRYDLVNIAHKEALAPHEAAYF